MKILIATDSFKDALSALEVCKAIERGILKANPNHTTTLFPLADGGEGTAAIFQYHGHGSFKTVEVSDPLFRKIKAKYLLSADQQTAFIEMAAAAGIQLLDPQERNPMNTTTFGVGELIRHALKNTQLQKIFLGIGGSATNDVGIGMASALGYRFLDKNDNPLKPIGKNLSQIRKIDNPVPIIKNSDVKFEVICDVNNPLFGKNGATHTYAKQKGASPNEIESLEKGVIHFSKILNQYFQKDFSTITGSGAAGGMGAGASAFLNASLQNGIETILAFTKLEAIIESYDLIITGEGKLDAQSAHGKLIMGITKIAEKFDIPVIAFCGHLDLSAEQIRKIGLHAAFSINPKPQTLKEALKQSPGNLENTAYNVVKMLDL